MVSNVKTAREAAKKALEGTYEGSATVIEHKKVTDDENRLTSYEDVVVLEGEPCRLSFSRLSPAVQNGSSATAVQAVKLFLSPERKIKPNSKIVVEQSGVVTEYMSSGVPAVYETHQEILLDLFREWA